jgi:signal transduction histidine kinase
MAVFFDVSRRRRGLVVALSLGGSTLLALALRPILHDEAQLLPFTLAVIASSTYGGFVAGVAATILSFCIADFFFVEPVYQILTVPGDYALLLVFLIFGISLSLVNHALARAKQAVVERSQQLARSNEELQRFAYSVSHDLQEPLRSISAFTELFLEKHHSNLDDESSRWLEFVRTGSDRMRRLIEAILEFSVAGRQTKVAEIDCGQVVQSTVQDLRPAIENSGAQVMVQSLPAVIGNEKQLGRVFLNLIGNAIKYHDGGRPVVIVISAEARPYEWVFSIKDNGPGIKPEYRERIFETFQRIDRKPSGYGLGLATCKRIIEQHGGKIWVESEPGAGADFRFTLPQPKI